MTRKTYCGNLLWQSGLTLLVPRKWKRQPVDQAREGRAPSRPSRFSGPSADDELQPSGLTGPVILKFCNYQ